MFEVGDHVNHEGHQAIITGLSGNSYQLRYLARPPVPQGRQARAEELEPLSPHTFAVGAGVNIAGIQAVIVEELPGNRYRLKAATGDQRGRGYRHTSEWTMEGWRIALQ